MPLPVCLYPPESTNYNVDIGSPVLSTPLVGGPARYRSDYLGTSNIVNVQWTCTPKAYSYMQAFYRESINYGADPFNIDLIIDANAVATYTVHIVPKSFKLRSQSGLSYVLVAQLEVIPNTADGTADAATVAAGPF